MSAVAKKTIDASLIAGTPGSDLLSRWGFDALDAAAVEKEVGYDITTHRIVAKTNTATETVAWLSDVNRLGAFRGGYNASTNALPTAATLTTANGDQQPANTPINAGDEILITTGTTGTGIVGLAAGSGVLQAGDILKAIKDNATVAADFIAIERNQPTVAQLIEEQVTGIALVADTALTVPLVNTYTRLKSWKVLDSTGLDVTAELVVARPTAASLTLLSSRALSALSVEVIGLS